MSTTYISQAIRKEVANRAKNACEYCLIPESFSLSTPYHIDHVISEKHNGSSEYDNLAYACPVCNISKGSDIATYLHDIKATVPLYNPRADQWNSHFKLNESGELTPLSEISRGTILLLGLNDMETKTLRKILIAGGISLIP